MSNDEKTSPSTEADRYYETLKKKYPDYTFHRGKPLVIDYMEFDKTIFFECKLIYKGGMPPKLSNGFFDRCQFVFENEALNTLNFIAGMMGSGPSGKEFVLKELLRTHV